MFKNGASVFTSTKGSAFFYILVKAFIFIFVIYAANLSYGFLHETGHALVIKTLGGQVYDIYVNPLGTDAYTIHSYVTGTPDTVILELAGMAVTTALAFFTLLSGYTPLPLFIALRTSIYALNYDPGTDIYVVHQAIGNASMLFSFVIIALNLACAAIALTAMAKNMGYEIPVLARIPLKQFWQRPG
jgi:hypothetical protein